MAKKYIAPEIVAETAPEAPSPASETAPQIIINERLENMIKECEKDSEALKNFDEWAAEKRLAGWQIAALAKAQDWQADKQISQAEFETALASFKNRPMGG